MSISHLEALTIVYRAIRITMADNGQFCAQAVAWNQDSDREMPILGAHAASPANAIAKLYQKDLALHGFTH